MEGIFSDQFHIVYDDDGGHDDVDDDDDDDDDEVNGVDRARNEREKRFVTVIGKKVTEASRGGNQVLLPARGDIT